MSSKSRYNDLLRYFFITQVQAYVFGGILNPPFLKALAEQHKVSVQEFLEGLQSAKTPSDLCLAHAQIVPLNQWIVRRIDHLYNWVDSKDDRYGFSSSRFLILNTYMSQCERIYASHLRKYKMGPWGE